LANRLDLGDLLMRKGWIDRSQLNRALAIQRQIPGRLGTCLLEINAISEDQLLSTLSEQLGAPPAPPEALRTIPQEVIDLVPASLARRGPAIPFKASGSRLSVALADIQDLNLHDEIAFAAGKRLDIHIASEARIHEALERYYGEESPVRFARLLDRLNRNRYLWNNDEKGSAKPKTASPNGPQLRRPAAKPPRNHSLHALYAPKEITLATLEPFPELPEVASPPAANGAAAAASEAPVADVPATEMPATQVPAAEAPEPEDRAASAPQAGQAQAEDREASGTDKGDETQDVELPATPAPPAPSIQLTAEEREALAASERRHHKTTLHGTLAERLGAAEDREEIGDLLLASLDAHFERSALLIVTGDEVRGWKIAGEGARRVRFEDLRVDLEEPSAFLNLQHGADFIIGPLADLPAHNRFLTCWLRSPEGADSASGHGEWLVPVRLKDRLVNVIYAQGERSDVRPVGGLRALRWFAHEAAKAFEDFILRKKSRLSKRAVEV
jgi:hypothetical protein